MRLLCDKEIVNRLTDPDQTANIASDFPAPSDWYALDSPVQPCSLDLHVGAISVPAKGSLLSRVFPRGIETREDYVLEPGHTAIVTTRETLRLPRDIAAIGFAPSRVSIRGLLIINPGHIDPGYSGQAHLTVINLGKEGYPLKSGEMILTLLFFQLDGLHESIEKSWTERGGTGATADVKNINRLSRDLLDLEKRAAKIARKEVGKAAAFGAIVLAIIGIFAQVVPYYFGGIQDLKRASAVESEQIRQLERRVVSLESELKSNSSRDRDSQHDVARSKGQPDSSTAFSRPK